MAAQENPGAAGATAPAASGNAPTQSPTGAAPSAPAGADPGAAAGGRGGRGGGGGPGARVDYRPNPRPNRVYDNDAVNKAFEALETFDWSMDFNNVIQPIDDAVSASYGNTVQLKYLEKRLADLLKTNVSRAAKDYCCRVLRVIGTTSSVPALAALLTDKDCSHMARYALEQIGGPDAVKAIREALPKVEDSLKPGMIEGLDTTRDSNSVDALSALCANPDQTIAASSIIALGRIGSPEAGNALAEIVKKTPDPLKITAADAMLVCAERLVADGKTAEATGLYNRLNDDNQPKHVRMAAARGLLAAAGKQ
jgi:hypothetical protein